jgi:hypothetical protein
MEKPTHFRIKFDTHEYSILVPVPPFVDILLKYSDIDHREFDKIKEKTGEYSNDPRLVEMVRLAGDASAKVPYLIDENETAQSILATLRKIAAPHVEYIHRLPEHVRATIYMLLSINQLPMKSEMVGIPALLEIDRIQGEMVVELHKRMHGRKMAKEFVDANISALHHLDNEWPKLRQSKTPYWPNQMVIPGDSRMTYEPIFDKEKLRFVSETCVIVDPPRMHDFKKYIPQVLVRPLPEHEKAPAIGSEDWLIREVGKIGRHFTRAMLEIIKDHLESERISLEVQNYELIDREAREALEDHIFQLP